RPLASLAALERRQAAVEAWAQAGAARAAFRESLRGLPDLERLGARLGCGKATPRDLGALRDALARLPGIRDRLGAIPGSLGAADAEALGGIPELAARLRQALVEEPPPVSREGGVVRAGYDA